MSTLQAAVFGAILLLAALPCRAEEKSENERPEKFTAPLTAEGAPLADLAFSALPLTTAWFQTGTLYGRSRRGNALYEQVSGQLSVGFSWSPKSAEKLAIGGKLAALSLNFLHTSVPPSIDEWKEYVDLGEFNLFIEYNAYRKTLKKPVILLTPFLRVHLPTDTSRLRDARKIPIKIILGGDVGTSIYFMIEPGLAFALVLGPATFYASTGLALGTIYEKSFLLLWDFTVGVAVKVPLVHLIAETGGMVVYQKNHEMVAWQVSPGIRFSKNRFRYEIAARFGLTPDSYAPFGIFTVGFTLQWVK